MANIPKIKKSADSASEALDNILVDTANIAARAATMPDTPAERIDPDEVDPVYAGENPETSPDIIVTRPEKAYKGTLPEKEEEKPKMVKIQTVCKHSCYIGGKPYHFEAGVPVMVPVYVKDILKRAGLLEVL